MLVLVVHLTRKAGHESEVDGLFRKLRITPTLINEVLAHHIRKDVA